MRSQLTAIRTLILPSLASRQEKKGNTCKRKNRTCLFFFCQLACPSPLSLLPTLTTPLPTFTLGNIFFFRSDLSIIFKNNNSKGFAVGQKICSYICQVENLRIRGNIIYFDKSKTRGISSATKPCAQYARQCEQANDRQSHKSTIASAIQKFKIENYTLYVCLILQYQYGLRISELLNARYSDIRRKSFLLIKGLKRSNDRLIDISSVINFVNTENKTTAFIFSGISRFYVYREYKKVGIEFLFGENKKQSVTHALRHLMISEMRAENVETKTTQALVGHKSQKSTEHYGG